MFKEYGYCAKNADGNVILHVSGIASLCLSGGHASVQTQVKPCNDEWRTAVLIEAGKIFQLSCGKWVFYFQPHNDGGYEYIQRGSLPVPLDQESSVTLKSLVDQYRKLKRSA